MPLPSSALRAVRDDHLAGRDPDPHLDLADRVLGVQRLDRVEDVERRADGALRVVLVGDRHAEVRDDRVADVLLDRAAVALELGAEAAVVELEQREHVLRVELLGERRRADEVDEDERVELALLVRRSARRRRRGLRRAASRSSDRSAPAPDSPRRRSRRATSCESTALGATRPTGLTGPRLSIKMTGRRDVGSHAPLSARRGTNGTSRSRSGRRDSELGTSSPIPPLPCVWLNQAKPGMNTRFDALTTPCGHASGAPIVTIRMRRYDRRGGEPC